MSLRSRKSRDAKVLLAAAPPCRRSPPPGGSACCRSRAGQVRGVQHVGLDHVTSAAIAAGGGNSARVRPFPGRTGITSGRDRRRSGRRRGDVRLVCWRCRGSSARVARAPAGQVLVARDVIIAAIRGQRAQRPRPGRSAAASALGREAQKTQLLQVRRAGGDRSDRRRACAAGEDENYCDRKDLHGEKLDLGGVVSAETTCGATRHTWGAVTVYVRARFRPRNRGTRSISRFPSHVHNFS